ncbi:MAG TPA: C-type lectin domain-containing protein [Kofleriaceae bacterium]|jgi:hypothetical protein
MRSVCWVAILLTACGRRDFDSVVDAPTLDSGPATCLTQDYDLAIPSGTFTYRLIPELHTFREAEASCTADGAHLAVLDAPAELVELSAAIDMVALPPSRGSDVFIFLGVVQTDPSVVDANWVDAFDRPFDMLLWGPGEPNDALGEERTGILHQTYPRVADYLTEPSNALCECDQRPTGPLFRATVAMLP